jgi:hypothetical protein
MLAEIKGRILRRRHLPIQRVHRSEGKKEPSKAAKFIKAAECYAMSLGVRFVGSSGGRASPLVKFDTKGQEMVLRQHIRLNYKAKLIAKSGRTRSINELAPEMRLQMRNF